MQVMVVCRKASLCEAYSILHKTVKIIAVFISISHLGPAVRTARSAFRRVGAKFL